MAALRNQDAFYAIAVMGSEKKLPGAVCRAIGPLMPQAADNSHPGKSFPCLFGNIGHQVYCSDIFLKHPLKNLAGPICFQTKISAKGLKLLKREAFEIMFPVLGTGRHMTVTTSTEVTWFRTRVRLEYTGNNSGAVNKSKTYQQDKIFIDKYAGTVYTSRSLL
jgi:hypothetical protein